MNIGAETAAWRVATEGGVLTSAGFPGLHRRIAPNASIGMDALFSRRYLGIDHEAICRVRISLIPLSISRLRARRMWQRRSALAFRRRPEPSRQRFRQPLRCSVADPGDIAVGADQHRGGRSDFAEHRKLPLAGVFRVDVLNAV